MISSAEIRFDRLCREGQNNLFGCSSFFDGFEKCKTVNLSQIFDVVCGIHLLRVYFVGFGVDIDVNTHFQPSFIANNLSNLRSIGIIFFYLHSEV
jgi:hypothetical protein